MISEWYKLAAPDNVASMAAMGLGSAGVGGGLLAMKKATKGIEGASEKYYNNPITGKYKAPGSVNNKAHVMLSDRYSNSPRSKYLRRVSKLQLLDRVGKRTAIGGGILALGGLGYLAGKKLLGGKEAMDKTASYNLAVDLNIVKIAAKTTKKERGKGVQRALRKGDKGIKKYMPAKGNIGKVLMGQLKGEAVGGLGGAVLGTLIGLIGKKKLGPSMMRLGPVLLGTVIGASIGSHVGGHKAWLNILKGQGITTANGRILSTDWKFTPEAEKKYITNHKGKKEKKK